MPDKKKSSVWRSASLTVILLTVCAILSVATINLVVIPFLNSANQPKAMTGSVPQVAQATATIDFEEGPPPPPTATGEFVRRPTPDVTQAKTLPTSVMPAEVPTLEPEVDIDAVAPTFAPVESVPPSGEWSKYTDPNLGFSFQYPSNWLLEVPSDLSAEDALSKGTFATIKSFQVHGMTKGGIPKDALKIEITVTPEFAQYGTIENWFANYRETLKDPYEPSSQPAFPNLENTSVDRIPAISWGSTDSRGSAVTVFGKGEWLFIAVAYPGTSDYISTFEAVLSGFQVP